MCECSNRVEKENKWTSSHSLLYVFPLMDKSSLDQTVSLQVIFRDRFFSLQLFDLIFESLTGWGLVDATAHYHSDVLQEAEVAFS